jgi:predicted nucleic acid-binding protein
MMRAVLADTGPLYAAIDPEDTHHARALQELHKLESDRREVVVLYSTLLEAYSLVLYRFGRDMRKRDQWLQDIENRQPNRVFPDTVRNKARVWRNLGETHHGKPQRGSAWRS